jgi:opacity protein-like surface antigen
MPAPICDVHASHYRGGSLRAGVAGLVIGSASLFAQSGEKYADIGEVSAYTGVAFGGTGTHPAVGGTTGVTLNKYAVALVDVSFLPIGSDTLLPYSRITATSRLYDFNFTVHIQIPANHRWAPYALLGPAVLYNTYQVQSIRPLGVVYFAGYSDVKFGFETGGGARYYVNEDWGVRGEYRYTVSTQNFSRILGGVFYRFSGPWPFLPRKGKGRGRGPVY